MKKPSIIRFDPIILVAQAVSLILVGYVLSTYNPQAPWATEQTFTASFFGGLASVVIFLVLGILGLLSFARNIGKKNYSLLVWVVLVTSLGFITLIPARFLSVKIAGTMNYQWTEQASQQRAVQVQQQLAENQVQQVQEPAIQKEVNQHDQLLTELYQKVTAGLEGQHRITGIDPANLRVTLDTGKTYSLNTDPIIHKTADVETIAIYNEIMGGGYKNHIYLFTAGDYQSFKNYYGWIYSDNASLQDAIENFGAKIFVIPIPKIVS